MERRTFRAVIIVGVLVMLSGCAATAGRAGGAAGAEGAALPRPDLVGTWRGVAFAVPGNHQFISAPVELTIKPDGTFTRTKRGEPQANGRVRIKGSRVILDEQTSKDVESQIDLQLRGDHLWGLSGAFIPGAPGAVDLERGS
jgi:hypothetical protein